MNKQKYLHKNYNNKSLDWSRFLDKLLLHLIHLKNLFKFKTQLWFQFDFWDWTDQFFFSFFFHLRVDLMTQQVELILFFQIN